MGKDRMDKRDFENKLMINKLSDILNVTDPEQVLEFKQTHHTSTKSFKFDKTRATGNELWRGYWPTPKPKGFYTTDEGVYVKWRFKDKDILNMDADELAAFIKTESGEYDEQGRLEINGSWFIKGQLTIKAKRGDILVLDTQQDVDAALGNVVTPEWIDDFNRGCARIIERLQDEQASPDQYRVEFIKFAREYGMEKLWKKVQRQYKAMVITDNFINTTGDIFNFHCEQLTIFDYNIIQEDHYEGTQYDLLTDMKDFGVKFPSEVIENQFRIYYAYFTRHNDMTMGEFAGLMEMVSEESGCLLI